jgi:hypothetical protein
MCFVAAKLYSEEYTGEEKIEAETLWSALLALLAVFVVSATSFFALMDRTYIHTFTTTMTAPQYCVQFFKAATTDRQRISVFMDHRTYYSSIDGELQAFIATNWGKWQAERPDWFTEDCVSIIPDRFIPAVEVERLNKVAGGQRRRSSFGGIGEGRRFSFRHEGGASVAPIIEELEGEASSARGAG